MKKIFLGLIVVLLATIAYSYEPVDCFQYYDFQNGINFYNMHADKVTYNPGDKVVVSYTLISQMDAPIVEGKVKVQFFYNDLMQGEQVMEEFFAFDGIYLTKGDKKDQEIVWQIPKNALSGEYTVKTYFIVGTSFNLGGISFLLYGPPGVPGQLTNFKVENTATESFMQFDRNNVVLNDNKYGFLGTPPELDKATAKIKTRLLNKGSSKNVNLIIKTYVWDDSTEESLLHKEEKTFSLGESYDIEYETPQLGTNAYEVVFQAVSGEEKAIMKMRFGYPGARARFIYFGLDKFPTAADTTAFFCFSNSADFITSMKGKLKVELKDRDGKVFYNNEDSVDISPSPTGYMAKFSAPDNDYAKMTATLYDEAGNEMDQETLVYDFTKFVSTKKTITISLDKNEYKAGELVKYTVNYRDSRNNPVSGEVVVYTVGEDGSNIDAARNKIDGVFSGEVKLENAGTYTIKAIDPNNQEISAEKTFTVSSSGGQTVYLVILLVVLIVIIAMFVMKKKK